MYDGSSNTSQAIKHNSRVNIICVHFYFSGWVGLTRPLLCCSHMCSANISHVDTEGRAVSGLLPRYHLTQQILYCITSDVLIAQVWETGLKTTLLLKTFPSLFTTELNSVQLNDFFFLTPKMLFKLTTDRNKIQLHHINNLIIYLMWSFSVFKFVAGWIF